MLFTDKLLKMNRYFLVILLFLLNLSGSLGQDIISFGTLIDEMTDLERLTYLPDPSYRVIQYSSYDRRSIIPGMEGWFSNADGFGNEPIPGFEEVLVSPDQNGIGTYLICDVQGAGAIVRRWTAGINGEVRCYLDNMEKPFYEGKASDFFWNAAGEISVSGIDLSLSSLFRQSDATYFPIPFSSHCRIEWIGDIRKIHFYHVGLRVYRDGTQVRTFMPEDLDEYEDKLLKLSDLFSNPDTAMHMEESNTEEFVKELPANSQLELLNKEGTGAISYLSFRIRASEMESALRQCLLNIYFDNAVVPQVQSPLGDFFGAAPGLNPYLSYPLSVQTDSTLVCRFLMPFRDNVKITVDNLSVEAISLSSNIQFTDYVWEEGSSMHFRARWRIDNGLTASDSLIMDIPYIMIQGKGRIVGVAAYLYNPSQAVTSWGNWWGEGDEKIYIDEDTFPSFFGTGSEDYFNYSWSSDRIFFFPYCGQPRNDGPGNRGYVSNFRWHILDDLLYQDYISFYMELFHHGEVPDFSYGRIVYAYNLPGSIDDSMPVNFGDIKEILYQRWSPEAYLGSAGFRFIEAEKIVNKNSFAKVENGDLYSEGHLLMWRPKNQNEKLTFTIDQPGGGDYIIGFTMAHLPGGGSFSTYLNGEPIQLGERESIDLQEPQRIFLRNYFSKGLTFKYGINEITFKPTGKGSDKMIGFDFLWLKKE
jgi:hypothetical protein